MPRAHTIRVGDRWAVVLDGRFLGTVFKDDANHWVYQDREGDTWRPETSDGFKSRQEAVQALVDGG